MYIHQLIYCIILVGIFGVLAKTMPPAWRASSEKLIDALSRLSRHQTLTWAGLGLLVLIVRLILLPAWPIPQPTVYDEFSYILQADTFAHGRLTNPPHELWKFFETPYIIQQPTYASRYPPAQSLVMAFGQLLFGHPWFGVWLSAGVLAAALCWALQGWLPPGWALFGAVIGLDLCLFSYWMNSYWGGAVAAIGGALVVGSLVRITRRKQRQYAWLLGLGAVILILARPFEGLLLLLVVLISLVIDTRSARVWLPILIVGLLGASWLVYDNYRVTGHPLRLPYRQYYQQYETVPPFSFLPLSKTSAEFRHFEIERWTRETYDRVRSWRVFVDRPLDWLTLLRVYYGNLIWLLPLAAFAPVLWRSRRTRFATVVTAVIVTASFFEMWWYPHYGAAFTCVLLLLAIQSMRYLSQWKFKGQEIGSFLIKGIPAAALLLVVTSRGEGLVTGRTTDNFESSNIAKAMIEQELLRQRPGRHVILVRHSATTASQNEGWVYNPADIDAAPVIWAQDLGEAENEKIRAYYPDRSFWLFKPNESMNLTPY